jgi:F-type H+-transporting ATPase subunit epsilon
MHVIIAKLDQILYDGEAQSLTVPGSAGEMTVLGHHEPLITTLKPGVITVRAGGEQTFPVQSGILEVRPEGATVIL